MSGARCSAAAASTVRRAQLLLLLLAGAVRSAMGGGFVCAEYDEEGDPIAQFPCPDCTADQKAEVR